MKVAFLAGPYSKPSPEENVKRHQKAAMQLMDKGYSVVSAVLMHHSLSEMAPRPYEFWFERAIVLIQLCDVFFYIPCEESGGLERELKEAGMYRKFDGNKIKVEGI